VLALGVDSATKTGLAMVKFENGRFSIVETRLANVREPLDATVGFSLDSLLELRAFVAMETPYIARGTKANPATLLKLARIFGWWEYSFALTRVPVLQVSAHAWQSSVLGVGPRVPRIKRKEAAIVFCMRMFKVELSSDEADAACIAYWAIKQQLSKGKR
jgi:hypothetical protein